MSEKLIFRTLFPPDLNVQQRIMQSLF
jgi:hypothetical protein